MNAANMEAAREMLLARSKADREAREKAYKPYKEKFDKYPHRQDLLDAAEAGDRAKLEELVSAMIYCPENFPNYDRVFDYKSNSLTGGEKNHEDGVTNNDDQKKNNKDNDNDDVDDGQQQTKTNSITSKTTTTKASASSSSPSAPSSINLLAYAVSQYNDRHHYERDYTDMQVSHGYDLNSKDPRMASLAMISVGNPETTAFLLAKGAQFDCRDKDNNIGLHYAAEQGSLKSIGYLCSMGQDPHCKNNFGKTPIDVAREKGHEEAVELLLKITKAKFPSQYCTYIRR